MNAEPLLQPLLDAVKRGVIVTCYLCLGYNDAGQLLPFQNGTNEMISHRLYTSLETDEERSRLRIHNYVGKDQTKPIHNKFKKRSCHIKLMIIDESVAIQGTPPLLYPPPSLPNLNQEQETATSTPNPSTTAKKSTCSSTRRSSAAPGSKPSTGTRTPPNTAPSARRTDAGMTPSRARWPRARSGRTRGILAGRRGSWALCRGLGGRGGFRLGRVGPSDGGSRWSYILVTAWRWTQVVMSATLIQFD